MGIIRYEAKAITTITLPPDIEAPLAEEARRQGTTTEWGWQSMRLTFILRISVVVAVFVSAIPHALAQEATVPGKILWGIAVGSSRKSAVAAAQKRIVGLGGKRQPPRVYRNGFVEDDCDYTLPHSDTQFTFEILSQHGKVVQLRRWTSDERGQTNLTFAQLIQRNHLQKRVYEFDDPGGGGDVGFYYDNIHKGICYALGTQDDFLLTYHPDAIIVHQPGVPALAIENGERGKRVTGQNARAFADASEARRADQHEQNK